MKRQKSRGFILLFYVFMASQSVFYGARIQAVGIALLSARPVPFSCKLRAAASFNLYCKQPVLKSYPPISADSANAAVYTNSRRNTRCLLSRLRHVTQHGIPARETVVRRNNHSWFLPVLQLEMREGSARLPEK